MNLPSAAPGHRIGWLLACFAVLCAGICGRLVALELRWGAAYRAEAARPLQQRRAVPAARGRILARDGTVLACDEPLTSLALDYRWLEDPPDPSWLRRLTRSRLTAAERRRPERVAVEVSQLLAEREDLHRRLAVLCELTTAEWQLRCERIQLHVQRIADLVNHLTRTGQQSPNPAAADSWLAAAGRNLWNGLVKGDIASTPAQPIVVAEQLQDHIVVSGLSVESIAEIEGHPERYPGVRLVHQSRRAYPAAAMGAHLLGFVAEKREHDERPERASRAGRSGVELSYDELLAGVDGVAFETLDRHGHVVGSRIEQTAAPGRDLRLTIDPAAQRTAEAVLDAALARRLSPTDADSSGEGGEHSESRNASPGGGAVIVMDVHSGAILAIASGPRFEPALLADPQSAAPAWERYRNDPERPLFDRAVQMALPPGSVFKTLTAVAMLHSAGFDPRQSFECQGYLHTPDRQRCAIYRHWGMGHGPTTLTDALARSCNVYFMHWAEQLGPAPIVDWAERFGFGARTGIGLPGEAAGHLPTGATKKIDATELAIGQGALTVTPLQVVRMMAAVANGGELVTPHVASAQGMAAPYDDALFDFGPPRAIAGLDRARVAMVREGLRRVTTDPEGTGYEAFHALGVDVSGKTGTAETGSGAPEHAWFAGYAPANAPKLAFVVVLEHAGDASATAAPAAARLVEKLQSAGYFGPENGYPDGP